MLNSVLMIALQLSITVVCVIFSFQVLKDKNLLKLYPPLRNRSLPGMVGAVAVSQVFMLTDTYSTIGIHLFHASLLGILLFILFHYRKKFLRMHIDLQERGIRDVDVPRDKYILLDKGVWTRMYNFDRVALVPWEKKAIKIADAYRDKEMSCLFFIVEDGTQLNVNTDVRDKLMMLVEGKADLFDRSVRMSPGDAPLSIPLGTIHDYIAIGTNRGVAVFRPK